MEKDKLESLESVLTLLRQKLDRTTTAPDAAKLRETITRLERYIEARQPRPAERS